ncbi:MAG: ferritin-like domain-containing protein [Solirubrobacteraceae bacterium]|nr:ferritin-like domain-containing protein [Solirubrobacteraceae bacterium]
MTTHLNLEQIDVDGTVRQAAEDAGAMTDRRTLLRTGAIAGATIGAGTLFGPMLSPAQAAIVPGRRSAANDVAVLKYALTLEYLESAFYEQALGNITFTDPKLRFFARVVSDHEQDHVDTLRTVLGRKKIQSPKFNFGDAVKDEKKFAATAQVLEDTGVAAYAGQGGNLSERRVIIAALSIHSVEARHAAWIRFLNGGFAPGSADKSPAPTAFDMALNEADVLAAVGATGFLAA